MSDYRRRQSWEAGSKAAREGKPRDGGKRIAGTIYYDDWHDGYDHAVRAELVFAQRAEK